MEMAKKTSCNDKRCNVAIFLDLDNLVIGATESDLHFDIELLITSIQKYTDGRLGLRRAYGDWRQHQTMPRRLASQGFELQSVVRLNSSDKNAADMQMLADAASTLIDSNQDFQIYVLLTGDRDFIPLVQLLHRYGKIVVGVGLRSSTNQTFSNLCDGYLYYDDMVDEYHRETDEDVRSWIMEAAEQIFVSNNWVQASLFCELVQTISEGQFRNTAQGKLPFGKALERYPEIVQLYLDGTTLYIYSPDGPVPTTIRIQNDEPVYLPNVAMQSVEETLHHRYRSELKKRGLRIVPFEQRLIILRDILRYFEKNPIPVMYHILHIALVKTYNQASIDISKSMITDVFRIARRSGILQMEGASRYADQLVSLNIQGDDLLRRAVILIDKTYVHEIESLGFSSELNMEEVSFALYQTKDRHDYLTHIHNLMIEGLN